MINPFEISYFATTETDLFKAINDLLNKLIVKDNSISLTFFGNTTINNYSSDSEIIKNAVNMHFTLSPLVSFIPQPLCDNYTLGVEVLQHNYIEHQISYKESDKVRYVIFNSAWGKSLLIENIQPDFMSQNYTQQSISVFKKINTIFRNEGFEVNHIVRQWNYIGNITNFENGNQHYQLFNDSRSEFYKNSFFENGYPAATGISMSINSVFVSLLAVRPTVKAVIMPIDNSLQIPAYNYSASVLVDGKSNQFKTTPKFERGKYVSNGDLHIFYVSGTAAIRNELSLNADDAALQTRQTIENIDFLISDINLQQHGIEKNVYLSLTSVRVYIKRVTDYPVIKAEIEKAWPNIEVIYLQAEVCRVELLVEIEGIAS